MICRTCDSEVPDDATSCPSCSTSVLDGDDIAIVATQDGPTQDGPPATRRERVHTHAVAGTYSSETSSSLAGGRFLPGAILSGRYRVVSLIGRGAMGEVYRADDLQLELPVALKFLPEDMAGDVRRLELFRQEVRLARRITHPNVCRVFDLGETEGQPYISMEYIDGENLATLLRRIGRLPRDKAAEIGLELCRGLEAAHRQGILHRDLKPANLMIDGYGRARITDFGLAGLAGAASRGGTPAYMAPEQLEGGEVTAAADLYALGLVLYELFTGQRTFDARSPPELARLHREEEPVPPSRLVNGLDPGVERIVLRCLAKDPAKRPASADAVAAVLGQHAVSSWRPEPGRKVPHRSHWTVEKKLGEGGFGEVWLARHQKTGERRVFKFSFDAAKLRALEREITLFRLLREELGERDDIARILDWNFEEAPYFIESEYTAGGNLVEWAESQGGIANVPLAMRTEIVARVAEALAAAHSVGVLHKDVKPANVLVHHDAQGRLQVRLADFGIGHVTDEERLRLAGITAEALTKTGASGTPLYRAPELIEGKPATVQADVYALGVMLYQMVVGDLFRALGPGWERNVDDELLREDVAAAVDWNPRRRLGNVVRIAERLRTLVKRRAELEAHHRAELEAQRATAALERSRLRLKWGSALLAAALVLVATLGFLALRIQFEAARANTAAQRAQDIARVAVASEWLDRDPTRAALVLLEVRRPEETAYAVARMRDVSSEELALYELRGHEGWVYGVEWSPDGRGAGGRLVTASQDGTARVWSLEGEPPVVLEGHGGIVWSATWSPEGGRVATTSEDGTVRVWRADGRLELVLEGHQDNVWMADWSPDGRRLVTASQDTTARVWDLAAPDGAPRVLAGHRGNVWSAAWSPDGRRLVTTSDDRTARLWDADGERPPVVLEGHQGGVQAAAWSPDGELLATVSRGDTRVRVWSVAAPARLPLTLAGHGAGVERAVWSTDGRRLVTVSRDGAALVWTVNRAPLAGAGFPRVLGGHGGWVNDAAWSPDGRFVATASHDGTARLWNAETGGLESVLAGHDGWVYDVAWSPDGRYLATASQDGTVRIWRLQARELVLRGHAAAVVQAVWSGDGQRVLTSSSDGTARVWRVRTLPGPEAMEPPVVLGDRGRVLVAAWSPDGQRVATVDADRKLRVWPAAGGRPAVLAGAPEDATDLAWSTDGRRLACAGGDGTARVWLLDVADEPLVLEGHRGAVTDLAWHADGERLASASADTTVRVWRIPASAGPGTPMAEPAVLEGHVLAVQSVAWEPGGERLASASADFKARVWHEENGGWESIILAGHYLEVRQVAWSADGRLVVTASQDGTARVWPADGGGDPIVLKGHSNAVVSASFDPAGERVVTASADGTAFVWPLSSGPRPSSRLEPPGDPVVLAGHTGPLAAASFSPDGGKVVTASRDGTARVWLLDTAELVAAIRAATRVCLDPDFRIKTLGEPPEEARRFHAECEAAHGRDPGPR